MPRTEPAAKLLVERSVSMSAYSHSPAPPTLTAIVAPVPTDTLPATLYPGNPTGFVAWRTPAVTVVVPEYEFTPPRSRTPAPTFVRLPVPLTSPLRRTVSCAYVTLKVVWESS